jgi:GNAT superfamily N-acetyltransferase
MLHITRVESKESIVQVQILFREYGSIPEVKLCVVNFEQEILSLPGAYAPPNGRVLLATNEGSDNREEPVGCIALRKWEQTIDTCELKRLYVRNPFRGHRIGRKLLETSIEEARSAGYAKIVLDTLPFMREAHTLYSSAGIREIPTYQKNPIPGATFFALNLS